MSVIMVAATQPLLVCATVNMGVSINWGSYFGVLL